MKKSMSNTMKIHLWLLLALTATPLYGDHAITKVSVHPQILFKGEKKGASIHWNTSRPASSKLYIYDADMNLFRTYVDKEFREMHQVKWDGKNERGEWAEPQIYIYRIETLDQEGGMMAYDPHLHQGGRDAIVYGARWDKQSGQIGFSMVSDSLVRVRVGIRNGPLLATPVEWIPVLKSDARVAWDGWDEGRTQRIDDPETLHIKLEGITLPENGILVKERGAERPPDYLSGKWLSDALAVGGKMEPREYDIVRKIIDVPRESGSVRVRAESGLDENGVLVLDQPRNIIIEVPEVENEDEAAPSYEVVFFLNRALYKESFITDQILTEALDPESFPSGSHTLTMNVIFGSARIGTQSIKIKVP